MIIVGGGLAGMYAAGEVSGFGGGGYYGYNALGGTFLGGYIVSDKLLEGLEMWHRANRSKGKNMSDYYCHQCASSILGFVQPNNITSLSASSYQLGKFIEHTAPSSSALSKPVKSIFDDPNYSGYKNYIINTAASGWVEQDRKGRINLAWYAGKKTGVEYRNGVFLLLLME